MIQKKVVAMICLVLGMGLVCINFASAVELEKSTENSVRVQMFRQSGNFVFKHAYLVSNEGIYRTDNIYKGMDYYGRVISDKGKILAYFPSVGLVDVIFWDNFDPKAKIRGGSKVVPGGEVEVRVPYFSNAKTIEFLDPNGKKLLIVPMSAVTR
jgi:TRAP-type mannitol/chloroaromatic compound transport system permease small subunit